MNEKRVKLLANKKNDNIPDLPGEIWMNIDGYDGYYMVSSFGRVKSFKRLKSMLMKPVNKFDKSGDGCKNRQTIRLGNSLKRKFIISRLVAQTFIGDIEGKHVHHIDGDTENNRVENLQILDPTKHLRDHYFSSSNNGCNMGKGENHSSAKLTERNVIEIKKILFLGDKKYKQIAEKFGVSKEAIRDINTGKTWGEVIINQDELKSWLDAICKAKKQIQYIKEQQMKSEFYQRRFDPNNEQDRAILERYEPYRLIGVTFNQFMDNIANPDTPAAIAINNEVKARQPAIEAPGHKDGDV